MKTIKLLIVFILLHLALSYFAPHFVPQSFFPYLDDLEKSGLPQFLYSFGNFDGTIYLKIARSGYLPLTHAFFPLYPLIIAALSVLFQPILAALLISALSLFGVLSMLRVYAKSIGIQDANIDWMIMVFLMFPTSFYLLGVYTESLFLFFLLSALYSMHKKQYVLAFIFAMLSALTRFVGIFLVIPLFFEILSIYSLQWRSFSLKSILSKLKKNGMAALPILGAPVGFLIYSLFLWKTTGDPIRFFNNLPDFQTGRQTDLILFPQVMYRYIKIFVTAQLNFQYVIAVIEFIVFVGVFAVLTYDLWKIYRKEYKQLMTRLGLNLFSFANLLLPTFTGTFTSLPRYVLASISFFIVVGEIRIRWLKYLILGVFTVLHIILFVYFIQGHFVS